MIRENIVVMIDVNGYNFIANGRTTVDAGWTMYYKPYADLKDLTLPTLKVNDVVRNLKIKSVEKHTLPPSRYNQASLVEKMEREQIGTKATRAEIVRMLIERGYIKGESIEATELGFAVYEVMQQYMPEIISTELTKKMESQLDDVELGKLDDKSVIDGATKVLTLSLEKFRQKESEVGTAMNDVIARTILAQKQVGKCPVCNDGVLRIIRAKKSGKRFAGCSNYENGCKASMPLPQTGIIRTTKKVCSVCKWPVIVVKPRGRHAWQMCINIHCETKAKK